MSKTIEFFWDSASPYTYLAATQIEALARRTAAVVDWKPFLLGKAFEATGNRAPASIPAKGKYLFDDLRRWAKLYGVPFGFPKVFPVASVTSLRIACALPAEQRGEWARAVMTYYWSKDADIGQREVLKSVLTELGWDADKLLAAAQDQVNKDALRANTDEAIKRGVFGAPSFFVDGQMFWGNDRLMHLEEFLNGKLAA